MTQKKILIIDDENVICRGCKMVFTEMGYLCNCCMTGTEGLKNIVENHYDVLLLDMKLKDMDGMKVLRAVKQAKPDIYVIVITGYSTVKNTIKAMKIGANDYISKPFTDDTIIAAVQNAFKN